MTSLRRVSALTALALALAPPSATTAYAQSAVGSAALAPAGKWQLDYQPTHCVAAREFGPVGSGTAFLIRPAPNGETYELSIVQRGKGPKFALQDAGTIDFGGSPIKTWFLQAGLSEPNRVLHVARISRGAMTAARTANTVRFRVKSRVDTAVQLSSMPALLDGLQRCTADLMKYWNHGGELDGRIAEQTKGNMGPLFRAEDFPQEAVTRGQNGSGRFLLLVDETGKVAGCHLVKSSGVPVFDIKACQVMIERAKFVPAKDRLCKPVRSAVTSPPIKWIIR